MSRSDDGTYIGQQVRRYRKARGMSQQQLADLIGKDRSYIAHIEGGSRPVDSRQLLYDLARELSTSVNDLTGQPYEPMDRQQFEAQATVARIQRALVAEGTDAVPGELRSIEALKAATDKALLLRMQADYVRLGQLVPGVISDLHAHIEAGHRRDDALAALTRVAFATTMGVKELGYTDLAWIAAQTTENAAARLGDPVAIAAAGFVRSQVTLAIGALSKATDTAKDAANALDASSPEALEIRGMLSLQSALCATALARQTSGSAHLDDAAGYFTEASDLAGHTGEGRAYQLRFGPTNVAVWGLSLAIERDEPEAVPEIAASINEAELDTATRKARFHIELGRALAKGRRTEEALTSLLRAEQAAPHYVRTRPVVRELTGFMLRDARRRLAAGPLADFAHRVGAAA